MLSGIRAKFLAYSQRVNVENEIHARALDEGQRVVSVDILRGVVMVLMVLDHVRDFFARTPFPPEDMAQTTPALFFTRWITHFCAPVFVFLTGVAAFLYGTKRRSRQALSHFLITRGLWLILVELVIVNLSWQSVWYGFLFVQVIWALGWSMIILACLIRLPPIWLLAVALVFILGHNLLDGVKKDIFGSFGWLWLILHQQGWIPLVSKGFGVAVVYPLIPWFALMAAGFWLGPVFLMAKENRKRILTRIGLGLVLIFLILRFTNIYGDPAPWSEQERGTVYAVLSILNTTKYPASLLFLAMTLGPALCLLPYLERANGRIAKLFLVFGGVPFFFYIIHIPLTNLTNHVWNWLMYGAFEHFTYRRFSDMPPEYQWNLWVAYGFWLAIVALLYLPCRWFANFKRRRRRWWMSYL